MSFQRLWIGLIVIVVSLFNDCYSLVEAPDGSVCFDNCNGHGHCIDYSCHCYPGYHGDDCKHTYLTDTTNVINILQAGHYNVTKKELPSLILKSPQLLVGFSSYSCHKCIIPEADYNIVSEYMKSINIPFVRANIDSMKSMATEYGFAELPALVFFNKARPYTYRGVHSSESIITYINKQKNEPATLLKSTEDVDTFLSYFKGNNSLSLSTNVVIGFFSSHKDMEEDEYDEFMDVARQLQSNEDVYFGIITHPKVAEYYKKITKIIDRTPSVMLVNHQQMKFTINLDEFYGEKMSLKDWIERKSIPLVGKLTAQNYRLYEKTGLPMLLMFLNLTNEHNFRGMHSYAVGGTSGGILNQLLVDELVLVAKEYSDKVNFVYVDGIAHEDQMKSLGLYGGKERLPLASFNTKDRRKVPFPEELPINYDTLNQYCAEFLSGRLRSPKDSLELVQKALRLAVPHSKKNTAKRKALKDAPEQVTGVSEQFGGGGIGDSDMIEVNADNFEDIAMNEEKDVVLTFYTPSCELCSHFAVYYSRMALRFRELQISSVVIARMDVSNQTPPTELNIIVSRLPLMVILPAGVKTPPWEYFSGISKVQQMMKWVQQQARIPFELPNLPHLSESNVKLFKQQVREREEHKDNKRREEEEAMEAEEKAQQAIRDRKKKKKRVSNEF